MQHVKNCWSAIIFSWECIDLLKLWCRYLGGASIKYVNTFWDIFDPSLQLANPLKRRIIWKYPCPHNQFFSSFFHSNSSLIPATSPDIFYGRPLSWIWLKILMIWAKAWPTWKSILVNFFEWVCHVLILLISYVTKFEYKRNYFNWEIVLIFFFVELLFHNFLLENPKFLMM